MAHYSHNNNLFRYLFTLVKELVLRYFLSLRLKGLNYLSPN